MTDHPLQLIDTQEVMHLTGHSRSAISRLRKAGLFPVPVRYSSNPTAKHWYYLHEIQDYIASLKRHDISEIKKQRKGK